MFHSLATTRTVIVQPLMNIVQRQQKRTILKWMTNYPSPVEELKKLHQSDPSKYTWQKHPHDIYVNAFGAVLFVYALFGIVRGHYRLATGKGKMP